MTATPQPRPPGASTPGGRPTPSCSPAQPAGHVYVRDGQARRWWCTRCARTVPFHIDGET